MRVLAITTAFWPKAYSSAHVQIVLMLVYLLPRLLLTSSSSRFSCFMTEMPVSTRSVQVLKYLEEVEGPALQLVDSIFHHHR